MLLYMTLGLPTIQFLITYNNPKWKGKKLGRQKEKRGGGRDSEWKNELEVPTISDIDFKTDILQTDDIFERQVSCTSLTLSVSAAAAVPIGYRIRVLGVIGAALHNEPTL